MSAFTLPSMFLNFSLYDRNDRLVRSWGEPGHSWVRNVYSKFFAACANAGGDGTGLFGAGHLSAKTTAGSVMSTTTTTYSMAERDIPSTYGFCNSGTNATSGIVVGSDDSAFDFDSFALGALIPHGSSSGMLSYAAMKIPVLDYTNKVWKATHTRTFTNFSGATITVREIGLYERASMFSSLQVFMLSRDVLAEAIEVEALAVLQVSIDISMDFSLFD